SKKKRNYLLEERDISKFEIQKEFINRNLVDTRYATREMVTLLKAYFSANDIPVNIKSINGSFTNHLRHVWQFPKHRDHGYKHHAEDALIIANADFLFKEKSLLSKANKIMNKPTTEDDQLEMNVKSENDYEEVLEIPLKVKNIKEYKKFKYNHMVDKKPNRQLINDTIYSTRKNEKSDDVLVNTIKDLYSNDNKDISKLRDMIFDKPEKILMYKNDPKTFSKMKQAFEQYSEAKNPLAKRLEEEGEYLTKYAKKNNGPVVKSIKVLGKKVGIHRDVSNKYSAVSNKVVQLSLKPFRMDLYKDSDGYKFLTVRYSDVIKKESHYCIDKSKYIEKLEMKKIEKGAEFINSFYSGDLIKIEKDLFRLVGVNDDYKNKIEVNLIDIPYSQYIEMNNLKVSSKQKRITIKKRTSSIEKYTSDVLG